MGSQCYLPPDRGENPAFIPPAEAGTRFSDPGGMQGIDPTLRGSGPAN